MGKDKFRVHAIKGCDSSSDKLYFEKICVFKKVSKGPSNLTLTEMLGSIITMTEEIVQKGKILVQTVMYNKKLKEKKVSI